MSDGVWTMDDDRWYEEMENRKRFPNSPAAKALRTFRVSDSLSAETILWTQVVRPVIARHAREATERGAFREYRRLRRLMKSDRGVRHAGRAR
jgi:hypothetical protein